MTNFSTSWHNSWRGGVFLMWCVLASWLTFDVTTRFWRNVFDVRTHFLTSWQTFLTVDVFLTTQHTFWCDDKLFDIRTYFLKSWWQTFWQNILFDVMTNFLIKTLFDVKKHFLTSGCIFWSHDDKLFDKTYFLMSWQTFWQEHFLMSRSTFWRHYVFLTQWRIYDITIFLKSLNFLTTQHTFWCHDGTFLCVFDVMMHFCTSFTNFYESP